jgi:NTE family protein
MRFRPVPGAVLRPEPLHAKAHELFDRYRPRIPFGLTLVEVPSLRIRLVRDSEITARHLAAACAIPFGFPPVRIQGKLYVDGGLRSSLPLSAAEAMGATHAVALNVLTTPIFRLLRQTMRAPQASPALEVVRLEPSEPLGSIRDALVWSEANIKRWIALGEADGNRAATSITTSITM